MASSAAKEFAWLLKTFVKISFLDMKKSDVCNNLCLIIKKNIKHLVLWLDKAESKLYDVTQGNIKKSTETAQDLVFQAKKKIEEISNKDGLSGIPSGFDKVDKITSGWQESDLIIVAARPGMGKTALTLSMARNISVNQKNLQHTAWN